MPSDKATCRFYELDGEPTVTLADNHALADYSELSRERLNVIERMLGRGLFDEDLRSGQIRFRNQLVCILDPNQDVAALIGQLEKGRGAEVEIRTIKLPYLEMLLMHPGAHPRVVERCADEVGGEAALNDLRGNLRQRIVGLTADTRIMPIGVSGLVFANDRGTTLIQAAQRRNNVAINPSAWTYTVDGGLRGQSPRHDFEEELAVEAGTVHFDAWRGVASRQNWEVAGVTFSTAFEPMHACAPVGLNFVFRKEVSADDFLSLQEEFAMTATHEEATQTTSVPTNSWDFAFAGKRPSESLLASVMALDETDEPFENWTKQPSRPIELKSLRTGEQIKPQRRVEGSEFAAFASDYFASLINRYAGLSETDAQLQDDSSTIEESVAAARNASGDEEKARQALNLAERTMPLLVRILAWLEEIRTDPTDRDRLETTDFPRLFEAVTYRVSALLFQGQADTPALLAELVAKPSEKSQALRKLIEAAAEETLRDHTQTAAEQSLAHSSSALLAAAPKLERAVGYLRDYSSGESDRYFRLRIDLELLLFSCALVVMRESGDARTADFALAATHQRSLSGNPLALTAKSSAIAGLTTASLGELRLGYEYCRAAIAVLPNNAGLLHTSAVYELRFSSLLASTAEERDSWLQRARRNVDLAVTRDPEWPTFYPTRASIRRRSGDFAGARMDLESAIDLVARTLARSEPGQASAPEAWRESWEAEIKAIEDSAGGTGRSGS